MSDITPEQVRETLPGGRFTDRMCAQLERQQARIASLESQIAKWERKEVQRGSCCSDNADRAEQAEAQVRALEAERDARLASRKRIEESFHHFPGGRCQCPYCTGNAEDLAELAGNYEMDLLHESELRAKAESALSAMTAERVDWKGRAERQYDENVSQIAKYAAIEAARDAALAALVSLYTFAVHKSECPRFHGPFGPCACGLSRFLDEGEPLAAALDQTAGKGEK